MQSYTEEQKYQARMTDMLTFLKIHEGFDFKRVGNEYHCLQHDSLVVKADHRGWYWNSKHMGGASAIDYCIKIHEKSFPQAMADIVGEGLGKYQSAETFQTKSIQKEKELVLPERADNTKRVYAYLTKTRGIDSQIVQKMISTGQIYQDTKGNAVFVGFKPDGKASFGCIRGTLTYKSYRGDCSGSDKRYSFAMESQFSKNKHKLFVFEAPIDLMSHATLTNHKIKNPRAWEVHSRLALAGTSDVALEEYLKNHPDVKELYLCLDGDEPGRKATQTIAQKYMNLGYKVFDCPPRTKDYNQDLISFLNEKIQEQNNTIRQKR